MRRLFAPRICIGEQDVRYVVRARNLARPSVNAPPIEAARALGEYAISLFLTQAF